MATDAPILAIAGPTAVGKSALALAVAERLGGEIVSADSRQVYRGMEIGTAAPTPDERARIVHHFVGERDPSAPWTAGQFAREAEERIADILARGGRPVVVGGSMLYFDALVRGIADLPPLDPRLRDQLTVEAGTEEGRERLFRELQASDPAAARSLDPSKSHRLVRLVGVLRTHGPPSRWWAAAPPPRFAFRVVVLDLARAELYARIARRAEAMIEDGLVDETRALLVAGHAPDTGPLRTIGYTEAVAYLRGDISADVLRETLVRNTRRFAKRQLTWLRARHADATWLDAALPLPLLLVKGLGYEESACNNGPI